MNEFKENLKRLMKNKKMSKSDLARAVGVKRQTVNLWTVGNTVPKASHLIKLSDIFNCSVDEILGHCEKTPEILALEEIITVFGREYTRLVSDKRVKLNSIFYDNKSGDLEITVEKGEDALIKEYGCLSESMDEKRTVCKNGYPGSLIVKTA